MRAAQPIRIDETCKVAFNPLFKKPQAIDLYNGYCFEGDVREGKKIGKLLEIRTVIFESIHENSVTFHTKMPIL